MITTKVIIIYNHLHGNKIINLGRLYIYNAVNNNNKRRTSVVGAIQKEKKYNSMHMVFITSMEKVGENMTLVRFLFDTEKLR